MARSHALHEVGRPIGRIVVYHQHVNVVHGGEDLSNQLSDVRQFVECRDDDQRPLDGASFGSHGQEETRPLTSSGRRSRKESCKGPAMRSRTREAVRKAIASEATKARAPTGAEKERSRSAVILPD